MSLINESFLAASLAATLMKKNGIFEPQEQQEQQEQQELEESQNTYLQQQFKNNIWLSK